MDELDQQILGLLAGLFVGRGCGPHPHRGARPAADLVPAVSRTEIWTCSMHPQIRQPKSGQCPICFMDLIPAATHGSGTDTGPREIELSAREFTLAETFLRHPDQVLSREQLLSQVWGYDFDPGSNVVDVYVRYLRGKIGADRIQTVRGVGYRLQSEDSP